MNNELDKITNEAPPTSFDIEKTKKEINVDDIVNYFCNGDTNKNNQIISGRVYQKNKKNIFNQNTSEKRFNLIYKTNFWSSNESVSGYGSELKNTINIEKEIISIIKKYQIKSILDAPCGDFNWIKNVLDKDLTYIGGDIVQEIIDNNIRKFKNNKLDFIKLDITKENLPDSDLMICRDCLIHLSFKSIKLFFENFKKSKINYLLLTTYKLKDTNKEIDNLDIPDGEYREIDLTRPPFLLPKPLHEILDKDELNKNSGFNCYLNLYTKNQINELKIK